MPLADAMSQLMSGAFTTPFGLSAAPALAANMNMYETNDSYILQVPLPGVQAGQLNMTARESMVTLQVSVVHDGQSQPQLQGGNQEQRQDQH